MHYKINSNTRRGLMFVIGVACIGGGLFAHFFFDLGYMGNLAALVIVVTGGFSIGKSRGLL